MTTCAANRADAGRSARRYSTLSFRTAASVITASTVHLISSYRHSRTQSSPSGDNVHTVGSRRSPPDRAWSTGDSDGQARSRHRALWQLLRVRRRRTVRALPGRRPSPATVQRRRRATLRRSQRGFCHRTRCTPVYHRPPVPGNGEVRRMPTLIGRSRGRAEHRASLADDPWSPLLYRPRNAARPFRVRQRRLPVRATQLSTRGPDRQGPTLEPRRRCRD